MPGQPVLEVEGLRVDFAAPRRGNRWRFWRNPKVTAVDGISLTVRSKELVALVGESGSGKTTTAHAILRLIDSGSDAIRLNGTDLASVTGRELRRLRPRMQLVYQDPYESLDPRCRVRSIIAEPIRIHGLAGSAQERVRMVEDVLARVGLTPPELFLDRYPHELSGGQRQRVAIAASLSLNPELLIVDEPVSMLDVSVRAGVLDLFSDLRSSGLAIMMITHDLATAAHYADRVAVMYLGRIVEEGPTAAVIAVPKHPYTKALLSVVPSLDRQPGERRQLLNDEIPDALHVPTGCRFRTRCPEVVDLCANEDPDLRLVGRGHSVACLLVPECEDC
jgi:oligopeptide/dipeptide ABC transporter ATP-binding protein